MASNITLSAGVRSNLLNLQSTAALKATTQERLSTGKKVNSALDNPSNYFTAASLSSRSSDLTNLLDGISNGIQTLKAADDGIQSITNSIQSLQATVRQARQDKSYKSTSYTVDATAIGTSTAKNISFSGGSVGSAAVSVGLQTVSKTGGSGGTLATGKGGSVDITIGSTTKAVTLTDGDTVDQQIDKINAAFGTTVASSDSGKIKLTDASGAAVTVADTSGNTNGTAAAAFGTLGSATYTAKSTDQLVSDINANTSLAGKIKATNDNGKLRIENDSTADLTVTGTTTGGTVDGGSSGNTTIGKNDVRSNLVDQFNEVRDQLNKLADDASFNGINLLKGDKLKLNFNETSTSNLTIQSTNANGISTDTLGITAATTDEFGSDDSLDKRLDQLSNALTTLRAQSSAFGSKLSIVQNRQDFTKALTNTLQTGSDNLTLADTNEEGANLLSLNTRQQLQTTSLSFASQADQTVLQFLR